MKFKHPSPASAQPEQHLRSRLNPLQRALSCLLALTLSIGNIPLTYAQVISDPHAGPYRPQVITPPNTNNVPVVNITAPSGAGVSRNQYQQFDVQQQGVILNNSRTNANTQLAGWIQGNPNLAGGSARIILNEVTSGNPSMLRGYVEIGGGRAEVIIANPAGIAVDGGGFINASGVTLTTGTPQFSTAGNLEGYRVGAGLVSINGQGLDTRDADYTAIISRAAQINSGIWANDLRITAGTGTVSPDATPIQLTVQDAAGKPLFAIDVAELGGMYAGKIRLIGTEAGVGVRNAGHIGASAGQIQVTADGQLINTGILNSAASAPAGAGIQVAAANITNSGTLYTQGDLQLTTNGQLLNTGTLASAGHTDITAQTIQNQNDAGTGHTGVIAAGLNTDGSLNATSQFHITADTLNNAANLQSGGTLEIQSAQNITNTGTLQSQGNLQAHAQATLNNTGTIYTQGELNLNAAHLTNQNTLASQGSAVITTQNLTNTAHALIAAGLKANGSFNNTGTDTGNLTLQTTGTLTNHGDLIAGHTITIQAADVDNQATGQIAAALTQINATQSLVNRGLIDGTLTYIHTPSLTNTGTGRIYGDHLAIGAHTLTNTAETINATTRAGTIAARQRLDLGIQNLINNQNAIIYSGGDIVIGGSVDTNHAAQGAATLIQNDGATIEAANNLQITAADIQNLNSVYASYQDVPVHVGHQLQIKIGFTTYSITDIVIYDRKTGDLIALPAGTNIAFLQLILGGNDHKSIITPSTQYPFDTFGPAGGLTQMPGPAYQPATPWADDPQPEKFNIDHTSNLWQLFGVQVPQDMPQDPGFVCESSSDCDSAQRRQYNEYISAFDSWKTNNLSLYLQLNNRLAAFRADALGRSVAEFDVSDYDIYQSQTVVSASNPGQILAGGNILLTGNTLNDKSRIMAGGTLQTQGNLTNNAATGQHIITHVGGDYRTYLVEHTISNTDRRWYGAPYNAVDSTTEYSLGVSAYEQNATSSGTAFQVPAQNEASGSAISAIQLPAGSLYQINPSTNNKYLIETDPRFASYANWLTSDYMLNALGLDPMIHKRLGDGFYEQQLIREQIGRLTGYRYLAGYQSDEDQYKALMNAGIAFAQTYHLSPGIALTAEQMQLLTSDIVWLVAQEVTLPDGGTQTVLVPQVYTRAGTNLITTDGALLSANNVYMIGQDGQGGQTAQLTNRATIAARQNLIADVGQIQNITTGHMHANDLALQSAGDINNMGGVISADNSLTLAAQQDINIASTVTQGYDSSGHRSNIGNTGVIYLTGASHATQPAKPQASQNPTAQQERPAGESQAPQNANNGQIHIQAGRDINLHAGRIINNAKPVAQEVRPTSSAAPSGSTTLVAGSNIHIGTVTTSQSHNAYFGNRNSREESGQQEIGSQIITQGDINLVAQNTAQGNLTNLTNLTIRASELESAQGAINASANTIDIQAGEVSHNQRVETYKETSSLLSSSTRHNIDQRQDQTLVGSSLSAQQINLQSTQDMRITASDLVATGDLNLSSKEGNITLQSGREASHEYRYERVTESGLLSGNGASMTVGSSQTTTTETTDSTYARGTTLGSLQGNINIVAQNGAYTQTGSDLVALEGDINVVAQDITIQEARETQQTVSTYDFKQTGVTLGLSGPAIAAVQTAQQMGDAADRSRQNGGNGRMQALAAGAVGLNLYNTFGSMPLGQAPQANSFADTVKGAGLSVSLSVGTSKASSRSEDYTDATKGSRLNAGGNINLVATGKPDSTNPQNPEQKPTYTGGNITVQGSSVNAQNNVSLIANDAIHILAARNTSTSTSTNESSSSSLGVNYSAGGIGISGSASRSQGNSNESEQSWSASLVNAGKTLTLVSGGDTHIIGSQVAGNNVIAHIGGDLHIQSLQDTSMGSSHSRTSGGGFNIGMNAGSLTGGISANSSKANANGIYASVNDYAGIMAGDGGFNITVAGNTDLKGAIIASTQEAVDHNRNSLSTGSLTTTHIYNQSSYDAKGSSMGLGLGGGGGSAGYGKESGNESSWTLSGISGGEITITDEQAQQDRTGQSAQEAIESVNRNVLTGQSSNGLTQNWNTDQLLENVRAQTEITAQFGQSASRSVGDYADKQIQRYQQAQLAADAAQNILNNPDSTPEQIATAQQVLTQANQVMSQEQENYDNWKEGGLYRVLAHTAVGGLTGDLSGAVGSTSSALAAGNINEIIKDLPSGVREAVGTSVAAGLGALTGGQAGLSSALNQDLNNRQLHESEIDWIKRNAAQFARQQGNITEEQAISILGAQALFEVDAVWSLKLGIAGYSFNEDAHDFLKLAGGNAFTATASQRGSGALGDSNAAIGFNQQYIIGKFELASTSLVIDHMITNGVDSVAGYVTGKVDEHGALLTPSAILADLFNSTIYGIKETGDAIFSNPRVVLDWANEKAGIISADMGALQQQISVGVINEWGGSQQTRLDQLYGDDTSALALSRGAITGVQTIAAVTGAKWSYDALTGSFVRAVDDLIPSASGAGKPTIPAKPAMPNVSGGGVAEVGPIKTPIGGGSAAELKPGTTKPHGSADTPNTSNLGNEGSFTQYLNNTTAPEIQTRLSNIASEARTMLPNRGNVAVAEVEIPSLSQSVDTVKAYSGYQAPTNGFVGKPVGDMDTWILRPQVANSTNIGNGTGAFLRDVDTEFKILENIAQRLGPSSNTSGTINLYTEKLACPSCSSVIMDFRLRYPNIQLNVFTNQGIP